MIWIIIAMALCVIGLMIATAQHEDDKPKTFHTTKKRPRGRPRKTA